MGATKRDISGLWNTQKCIRLEICPFLLARKHRPSVMFAALPSFGFLLPCTFQTVVNQIWKRKLNLSLPPNILSEKSKIRLPSQGNRVRRPTPLPVSAALRGVFKYRMLPWIKKWLVATALILLQSVGSWQIAEGRYMWQSETSVFTSRRGRA